MIKATVIDIPIPDSWNGNSIIEVTLKIKTSRLFDPVIYCVVPEFKTHGIPSLVVEEDSEVAERDFTFLLIPVSVKHPTACSIEFIGAVQVARFVSLDLTCLVFRKFNSPPEQYSLSEQSRHSRHSRKL